MNEELVAVVSPQTWKRECDRMPPEQRERYPPDGTQGEVGKWEGVRIIVQDSIPSEWKTWGYLHRDMPAVFL